jgi:hypothetical protein
MKKFSDMTYTEIKCVLSFIGLGVKKRIPPGALFVVLIFDDTGIGRYTSNANRKDIIKAMREYASVLEKMEDTPT